MDMTTAAKLQIWSGPAILLSNIGQSKQPTGLETGTLRPNSTITLTSRPSTGGSKFMRVSCKDGEPTVLSTPLSQSTSHSIIHSLMFSKTFTENLENLFRDILLMLGLLCTQLLTIMLQYGTISSEMMTWTKLLLISTIIKLSWESQISLLLKMLVTNMRPESLGKPIASSTQFGLVNGPSQPTSVLTGLVASTTPTLTHSTHA